MIHSKICEYLDNSTKYEKIKTLKDLFLCISACFNMDYEEFKSHSRLNNQVKIRHLFIHYAVKLLKDVTLVEIGNFCHRDHTSIMHSRNKFAAELKIGYDDNTDMIEKFEQYIRKRFMRNVKYVNNKN